MTFRCLIYQAVFVLAMGFFGIGAKAHEFWIDPLSAEVQPGDEIRADLRVGERMKGSGLIFNPASFTKFSYYVDGAKADVMGRLGDRPATRITGAKEGLNVVAHMTTASKLTYQNFDKFAKFAKTHGQAFAIARHRERGLPETDFTEAYFRCAKALIKVGAGAGRDRTTGMPFELTALNNPYTDSGPVRFLLTYKGKPKAGHQVDVFHRSAPGAEATLVSYETNSVGEVSVPRVAGRYLVNAVVLEEPKPNIAQRIGAVWVSLWASTTYDILDG